MIEWYLVSAIAAAAAYLGVRGVWRRRTQEAAADAAGLQAVRDLTHLPPALQRTALWALGEGGFERRVAHGVMPRKIEDVDVTAFDLETLRESRGEWAYLPVEPPFRIAGMVSVAVCEIDRRFPHLLFKRDGLGDAMIDDDVLDRAGSLAKSARDSLGIPRTYAAELPPGLGVTPIDVELPPQWRVYGSAAAAVEVLPGLLAGGFSAALAAANRRDLVVELIDSLVVVYPAARDVVGADAFADLTTTALALTDGVLAATPRVSPRGLETQRAE